MFHCANKSITPSIGLGNWQALNIWVRDGKKSLAELLKFFGRQFFVVKSHVIRPVAVLKFSVSQ